jgi:hypothetical protein
MNKIMFVLSCSAMVLIGYFYIVEIGEVQRTKEAVTAAANATATKLSQAPDPQKNTDADAEGIFKQAIEPSAVIDDLSVKQNVQPLSPGHFRQFVSVKGRAVTTFSKNSGMEGAVLDISVTRDFERSQ